ncbi:MAG: galactose-1-phosphate uridylyltransferase [Candidatus Hodarchaeota archaeon]
MNELRWNPFARKWIIVAPKRENRPLDIKSVLDFESEDKGIKLKDKKIEKKKSCPFCVGAPEVPETFDVKVLPNRFPALSVDNTTTSSKLDPDGPYKVKPAIGHQEVILYSPDHEQKLANLPVDHVFKLVKTWKERYIEIGNMPEINYVFEFENKGKMIGVSLIHPHGQIYAFAWIPLYIQLELQSFKEHFDEKKCCLLCDIIRAEIDSKIRIIHENKNFISCVPFFAAWPHEVHIYSKKHVQSFADFDDEMMMDYARILKDINYRYDNLYPEQDMSFVMAVHQKPTDGKPYDHYHFHVEFYPPVRKAGVQKFAAGVELGTGTWINSSLPENFAKRMREIDLDG